MERASLIILAEIIFLLPFAAIFAEQVCVMIC